MDCLTGEIFHGQFDMRGDQGAVVQSITNVMKALVEYLLSFTVFTKSIAIILFAEKV